MIREGSTRLGSYKVLAGGLRLGMFGVDHKASSDTAGARLVRRLRPGEALSGELFAALEDEPSVVRWEADGTDPPLCVAPLTRIVPWGIVVSGSELQNDCNCTATELQVQSVALKLRRSTLRERVGWARDLCGLLLRLEGRGIHNPFLTPWGVGIDVSGQLKLSDVGFSLEEGTNLFPFPDDTLSYMAPEMVRALAEGSAAPPTSAATAYAFAATTRSFLHNRGPEPARDEVKIDAASERRALILQGSGLDRPAHERYSDELEALLGAALAPDPAARPGLAEIQRRLGELLAQERIDPVPPARLLRYVLLTVLVVVSLAWLLLIHPPESRWTPAFRAFAEASQLTDPLERSAALEQVQGPGGLMLPEARRLKAIADYQRWLEQAKLGREEGKLEAVLDRLEADAIGGYEDELSDVVRLVVGLLRRWQLGSGLQRKRADELLRRLEREGKPEDVRLMAAAARVLTATGGDRSVLEGAESWREAAKRATEPGKGLLTKTYPLVDYASLGISVQPTGASLSSGWIGDLLVGRLEALRGEHAEADTRLRRARDTVAIFATRAALAIELAGQGNHDTNLVAEATMYRQCAELQLIRAKHLLDTAVRTRHAGDFDLAAGAYEEVLTMEPDTPGARATIERSARRGIMEADFHRGVQMAFDEPEAGERELRDLLDRYGGVSSFVSAFGADTHVALGFAMARQGKGEGAYPELLHMFAERRIDAGWARLPELDPAPPTRDRARVVSTLLGAAAERVSSALERGADPGQAGRDLSALFALEEAKRLDATLARLALARVDLWRAGEADPETRKEALVGARQTIDDLLSRLDPERVPELWLEAVAGRLDAAQLEADSGAPDDPVARIVPLQRALRDLDGFAEAVAKSEDARADYKAFRKKRRDKLVRRLITRISAYVKDRREAWEELTPGGEGVAEAIGPDIELLEGTVALFSEEAQKRFKETLPPNRARRIATYHQHLARLYRARQSSAWFAHTQRALDLYGRLPLDPVIGDLEKQVHYFVGDTVLQEGDRIKSRLEGADPVEYARDALARACGAEDFASLKSGIEGGEFTPLGPAGEETAPVKRLADAVAEGCARSIPLIPAPGVAVPGANTLAADLVFAVTKLNAKAERPYYLLSAIELCKSAEKDGKPDAKLTKRAGKTAKKAYGLATKKTAESLEVRALAARVHCFARAQEGPGAIASKGFRDVAVGGAKAAAALPKSEDPERLQVLAGPAYWVARSHYEQGLVAQKRKDAKQAVESMKQAEAAYAALEGILGKRAGPPEAAAWSEERAKAGEIVAKGGK